MPSKTGKNDAEGFGTVFLEAGLLGKPSVGTTSGGIREAIVDHKTGIIVPEQDVESLREALTELLSNESERRALGRNAREFVISLFTWEACTDS
jgi:glycosyltransferase involved in cell wall biosynthesis